MTAPFDLHLAVRTVHVLGMAVLLGGAAFTWGALRTDPEVSLRRAVDYEWVFWGTAGAMLATGVGNLAAVGAPGPATRWGTVSSRSSSWSSSWSSDPSSGRSW